MYKRQHWRQERGYPEGGPNEQTNTGLSRILSNVLVDSVDDKTSVDFMQESLTPTTGTERSCQNTQITVTTVGGVPSHEL